MRLLNITKYMSSTGIIRNFGRLFFEMCLIDFAAKSRKTKTRHHQNKHRTDKAGSHVRRKHKHKYGGPQLSRQKQFSLVFVYFYSQFYSLPKNFWFRQRPREARKHDIYPKFRNMKSLTVFCLAEGIT